MAYKDELTLLTGVNFIDYASKLKSKVDKQEKQIHEP